MGWSLIIKLFAASRPTTHSLQQMSLVGLVSVALRWATANNVLSVRHEYFSLLKLLRDAEKWKIFINVFADQVQVAYVSMIRSITESLSIIFKCPRAQAQQYCILRRAVFCSFAAAAAAAAAGVCHFLNSLFTIAREKIPAQNFRFGALENEKTCRDMINVC